MNHNRLHLLLEERNLIQWILKQKHTEKCSVIHNNIELIWHANGILELAPDTATEIDLVISCGIHGNETAPIEMTEQLFEGIVDGQITLRCRLLIIFGNMPAIETNKRFVEENLNRLFSGKHLESQTREGHRAKEIEYWVEQFYSRETAKRIHFDLHTAIRGSQIEKFAIYPYNSERPWSKEQINWLTEAGIEAILLGHQPSGTFSYYTSAKYGAMAFTIELGKALAFGENDHHRLITFKAALINLLQDQTDWQRERVSDDIQIFSVVDEVLRLSKASFHLNLDDDFLNFTSLEQGFNLTDDSPNGYVIKSDNHRIVFPNKNVPQGQRVALVVEPCDLTQIQ